MNDGGSGSQLNLKHIGNKSLNHFLINSSIKHTQSDFGEIAQNVSEFELQSKNIIAKPSPNKMLLELSK